jgi:hypothetical protein
MHVPIRVRSTGMRRFAIALGVLVLFGLIAGATFAFAGSGHRQQSRPGSRLRRRPHVRRQLHGWIDAVQPGDA